MPGGRYADEADRDPDYEAALRAFVAAHPESPDAGLQRALEPAPSVAVAPGTRAPPPMNKPVAALDAMANGASQPRHIVGPTLTLGPGGSVGTYDDVSPELTPEEKAAQGPLAMPPAPNPSASMGEAAAGVAPVAAQKNKGVPTVQVGHPAQISTPNTAVVRSALSAPLAPGEGKAPPQAAPPASPDPVQRALTAAALSAKPPQGDTDLEAALQAAAGRRLVAGLARAGGTMIGRGQGAAYDALDAEADRPLQEMQLRRGEAARQEEMDPTSSTSQTYRALLAQMVPDLAKQPGWENRSAAQIKSTFPVVEKMAAIEATKGEKGAELEREKARDSETVRHDKAMEAIRERAHGGGAGGGQGLSKEAAKELAVLQRSWDPSGPRSGERGKNRARLNAAGRIEALAGQNQDLSPQQMTELARQLDSLLSNGGQATEGVTRALTAQTASGKVAELEQWLTSEPHGAGQRAFVKQMLETARREKDVAGKQLQDSYVQTLPSVPTLLRERPDVVQNMLRAAGVDPSSIDLSTGLARPGGGPTPSAGGGAPRKQYSPSRNQTRLIYPDGRVEVRDGRV